MSGKVDHMLSLFLPKLLFSQGQERREKEREKKKKYHELECESGTKHQTKPPSSQGWIE